MPLKARRIIRKMRGGAQAHLLEADDGNFYVVKFLGNPQHRRVLVNEWIASVVLRYLQIASPEVALIEAGKEFFRENEELAFQLGGKRAPIEPGWHFGSRYPGDPEKVAVYDILPDALLEQVSNVTDFNACMVFDKWMGNVDTRQAIFFRAHLKEWMPDSHYHPRKLGFVSLMIDHGFVFNGPYWDFPDSPIQGVYHRRAVYRRVTSIESFQPWLDRVYHFPAHVLDRALKQIPAAWLEGEEENAVELMCESLMRRCRRVGDLLSELRRSRENPFENWK